MSFLSLYTGGETFSAPALAFLCRYSNALHMESVEGIAFGLVVDGVAEVLDFCHGFRFGCTGERTFEC